MPIRKEKPNVKLVKEEVVKNGRTYNDYYLVFNTKNKEDFKLRVRTVFPGDYWRLEELCKREDNK